MMPANNPKRKLGQVDLINISAEGLQFGWTQTVFLPRWAVFPGLISDTAHLNEDDHGSHGPVTGVTNKGLSPGIHVVICINCNWS